MGRQAAREFEALPAEVIERVRPDDQGASLTPSPAGVKKLRDAERTWRIRIGDWRVLYEIEDRLRIVDIAAIRHRSKAYD